MKKKIDNKIYHIDIIEKKLGSDGDWYENKEYTIKLAGEKKLIQFIKDYKIKEAEYHKPFLTVDTYAESPLLENSREWKSKTKLSNAILSEYVDKIKNANKKRTNKTATTTVVTILALFGMYLMSLQMGNGSTGYATCLDNGNVLIGGIALVVIILLFVLISTRKMGKETVQYVPMKSKRKSSSKRKK